VAFECEGLRYVAQLDEGDDRFVQLNLTYSLREPRPTKLDALRAAHDVQGSFKCVRIFILRDRQGVEFQASLFVGARGLERPVFRRCLAALQECGRRFHDRLVFPEPVAQA
jgi:hypothetical protein